MNAPLFYSAVELEKPIRGKYLPTSTIIHIDFKISNYTCSGICIDSVNIHNESYTPFKGGRSLTESGYYQIRYSG